MKINILMYFIKSYNHIIYMFIHLINSVEISFS